MLKLARKRRQNEIGFGANTAINILFLAICVLCIAPVLLVLSISITDEAAIRANGYQFIPSEFSGEAYRYLLTAGDAIWRAYGVSILVTVVGTL